MSDTFDSSAAKTTHFKGSEDGEGDVKELKDMRGNCGPRPPLRDIRGNKESEERLVGRKGVISRLRTHKCEAHDKCVGVQKRVDLAERCLQAFISSYDSVRMRGSQKRGKSEREELKTEVRWRV